MASTSHSGQIRNSHSPSVIALSSAKAPSTTAAKPRFRSRTGCWTCRKRKVKCDERGRSSETVAYGGLLSTSSGCKRCEDSGRPCHGYGTQPPSPSLLTHYPPSSLNLESSLVATPFYSFSSHAQRNVSIPGTFPTVMSTVEPDSRYIPQPMQWTRPFEQSLPENQAINYGLRMLRNAPSCSSPVTASLGSSSLVPMNQASIHLPSVDLRRLSVPNYPTWQRSPQPRNTGPSYLSGGLSGNAFSVDQASSPYDNIEAEAPPPTNVTSAYERPDSILQVGECNALSADAYQNITQNDISPGYSHDMSESDTQSLCFDFTRPHTSSGITLSHDDPQSHQHLPRVYGSPIIANPKEFECIEEASGAASTSLPTCPDASIQVWPEHQTSSASIATFRPLPSSALNTHPLDPVQNTLFSSHHQANGSPRCQPTESFRKADAADIPPFQSIRDIPYDVHAAYPPQRAATCSAVCEADNVLSVERCCSDSANQATERPLHLFQMNPGSYKTFAEMMAHDPRENLRQNSCSYVRLCPLPAESEGKKNQSPSRKMSSSSLSSSHSTQEHKLSPVATITQKSPVKNPCSTNSSLASLNPANHFYRPSIPPQRLSRCNPSPTALDLCGQPSDSGRWASHGLISSLESPPYDFKAILDQKGLEFQSVDAYEDDSPTSTAPSNTSGAPGAN